MGKTKGHLEALLGEPGYANDNARKVFKKHVSTLAASLSDVLGFWFAVHAFSKMNPTAEAQGKGIEEEREGERLADGRYDKTKKDRQERTERNIALLLDNSPFFILHPFICKISSAHRRGRR
jgi:hypothetical protein